jgi:hypothetical protein
MPSTYGAPAKVNVMEEDNKIKIKLLSYDENGNLIDTVSNTLKNNILNYLSEFRMINDYIEIQSGEVIDLGLEIDLVVDKNELKSDIIRSTVNKVIDFFAIEKRKMGDPLFVGNLIKEIGIVGGVVNVVDIRVYTQTINESTREITQTNKTIYMKSNQIYQIRFPNIDIKVRTINAGTTTY